MACKPGCPDYFKYTVFDNPQRSYSTIASNVVIEELYLIALNEN